jgi:XTP/dITP diphosphohydrolase
MVKQPIIIEDDGLFIKSLNGFPGQYSSYSFATIGNRGILKLMKENLIDLLFRSILFIMMESK